MTNTHLLIDGTPCSDVYDVCTHDTAYATRNLTDEESAALMRKLTVAVGHTTAQSVLRVIAEFGAGVFMADEVTA